MEAMTEKQHMESSYTRKPKDTASEGTNQQGTVKSSRGPIFKRKKKIALQRYF